MQRSFHYSISMTSHSEHLNRSFRKAIETKEAGCGPVTYHRTCARIIQGDPKRKTPGARGSGEHKAPAADPLKPFAIDPPLNLHAGNAEIPDLCAIDYTIVAFGQFCERTKERMHRPKVCEPIDRSETRRAGRLSYHDGRYERRLTR